MSLNIFALAERVQAERKKKGLSQNALSEMIDKSPTYLSYIENATKCMSLETFVDLANALNTTADDLLRDSLKNSIIVANNVFSAVISDCNDYEQRILLDLLVAAKEVLRSNEKYHQRNIHRL